MTEKKANILTVALRLFATQGYENTPTSKIAKEAGVSEGLLFKHFENKEGLLMALMAEGQDRIQKKVDLVIKELNPKKRLALTIDLTFQLIKEEREFWTLQFTLKYTNKQFAALKKQSQYLQTLFVAVQEAFVELNYPKPQMEAEYLMICLEGLSSMILTQGDTMDVLETIDFIKSKYAL